MAHGVVDVLREDEVNPSTTKMVTAKPPPQQRLNGARKTVGVMGSRRIFPPAFKLKVLDSYRNDAECRGNQRATARKYGIHRRQIQKWLQCEDNLRKGCAENALEKPRLDKTDNTSPALNPGLAVAPRIPEDKVPRPTGSPLNYAPKNLVPSMNGYSDIYHRNHQFYNNQVQNWSSRCDVKHYSNGGYRYDTLNPGRPSIPLPLEIKAERTSSPEGPGLFQSRMGYEQPKIETSEIGIVKKEMEEEDEEDAGCGGRMEEEREDETVALKKERASPDSETRRGSPARVSPLTPSQEPSSPQGPSSYRSSSNCSDSEMDAEYSSSSSSSTQHQGDLARRRSFSLRFKLDVLNAFHRDAEVAGNQRATAKKFGINRRQVQKWLGQENVLRDEIKFRGGNSRQRLGSLPDQIPLSESPVDLRTKCNVSEMDVDRSNAYCCETDLGPQAYVYCQTSEPPYRTCSYSCCTLAPNCYPEANSRRTSCYEETKPLYCYSPVDPYRGNPPCCYSDPASSPKGQNENGPPQDAPLCLVKSKSEPTVAPSAKKDAILFKPYLDNPISRPSDEPAINNNNNNCKNICNLNENKSHDYALELNLQVPVSWSNQPPPLYVDLPQVRSAFVRYPASSHFT